MYKTTVSFKNKKNAPNTTPSNPIVVLGGTGHYAIDYGRHLIQSLVQKNTPVRVLTRNVDRARFLLGDEPEIIEGNVTDAASLSKVLQGARAVVISVSAIEIDAILLLLDKVREAGISRVVYLSVYEVREHIKLEMEQTLKASNDLNLTILSLSPSMDIFFSMIRGDTMMVPGGGPPALPTISPVDAGEIVAQAVLRDDLNGQSLHVTGPEALSFPQAAERIKEATGRSIGYKKMALWPIRVGATISRPFNPFLSRLYQNLKLLHEFPEDLARAVPRDHQHLRDTFEYIPMTLEMEAKRRSKIENAEV